MIFWAGIVRHSLSDNQIVKYFKLKKLKKDMRCQVDFFLPLKLEEILCYFGLWPQNTLGQSVCRIFYFWLVWLVKFNTGVPLLHCTCSCSLHCIFFFLFYPRINKPDIHNNALAFEVYKMGFRTFLAPLVSILRVKEKNIFFLFLGTSQNIPLLCLWRFFLPWWLSNQLNFSVSYVFIRCFWWSTFPHNYQNTYGHQTFQGGDMQRGALTHKYAWHLNGKVLLGHVTNKIISPSAEDVSTPQ